MDEKRGKEQICRIHILYTVLFTLILILFLYGVWDRWSYGPRPDAINRTAVLLVSPSADYLNVTDFYQFRAPNIQAPSPNLLRGYYASWLTLYGLSFLFGFALINYYRGLIRRPFLASLTVGMLTALSFSFFCDERILDLTFHFPLRIAVLLTFSFLLLGLSNEGKFRALFIVFCGTASGIFCFLQLSGFLLPILVILFLLYLREKQTLILYFFATSLTAIFLALFFSSVFFAVTDNNSVGAIRLYFEKVREMDPGTILSARFRALYGLQILRPYFFFFFLSGLFSYLCFLSDEKLSQQTRFLRDLFLTILVAVWWIIVSSPKLAAEPFTLFYVLQSNGLSIPVLAPLGTIAFTLYFAVLNRATLSSEKKITKGQMAFPLFLLLSPFVVLFYCTYFEITNFYLFSLLISGFSSVLLLSSERNIQ